MKVGVEHLPENKKGRKLMMTRLSVFVSSCGELVTWLTCSPCKRNAVKEWSASPNRTANCTVKHVGLEDFCLLFLDDTNFHWHRTNSGSVPKPILRGDRGARCEGNSIFVVDLSKSYVKSRYIPSLKLTYC